MFRPISRVAVALSLSVLAAGAVQAQTVDEIVAKNLQAKGGAQKWRAVESVKMTGKVMVQGLELPLTVYAKRPNRNRQEVGPPNSTVVQAFDGTTAWMLNPMAGMTAPEVAPAVLADMMKNSADFDGALIDYKAKGHTIELVGKETLGDKAVYHLRVTMKGGHVQDYFLDAETGIELKTSAQVDLGPMGGGGGQKQTLDTEMSNYKAVEGIMLPHTVKQFIAGKQTVEMAISSVEFNVPMDDALFSMPKK